MPDNQKKFYLTTPIYYVNARPHIGHAYTTIAADVIARRHRLLGEDVFFLTGTDEHGQKIERAAAASGIPPQQFADQVSASFSNLWQRMGITHNKFIRTTDPAHKRGAQKLFQTLFDNGFIELRSYTGTYCVSDEAFVDVPVGTPCPECGRITETITEENFFFKLSKFQEELINRIESNDPDYRLDIEPESRRNEVLSFLRGPVSEILYLAGEEARDFSNEVGKLRDSELLEFAVNEGSLSLSGSGTPYVPGALKDLSISRTSFKWGIPVPGNPATNQDHVIYVWLDALANYITAIGYGSDDPTDIAQFAKYWPADLHLVGKEIIRFHCVYWPAFLLAANLPLPKKIQAHGWLLFEESKMSKSRGNIVRTETILDAFGPLCPVTPAVVIPGEARNLSISPAPQPPPDLLSSRSETEGSASPVAPPPPTKTQQDLFASDVIRYFLLREIPFGQDGSFSFDALITRYNADLVNGFGNLVSRTLTLATSHLHVDTERPATPWLCEQWQPMPNDKRSIPVSEALSGTASVIDEICKLIDVDFDFYARQSHFHLALAEIFSRVSIVDGYLSWHKPWMLAKSNAVQDRKRLVEVLYTAAESIRIITALLYPVLPYATASVWSQLGLGSIEEAAANGELKNLQWGGLKPGTKLGPLAPIFPRADKGLAQIMTDMESPTTPEPTAPTPAPESVQSVSSVLSSSPEAPPLPITIDDFLKVDLRVAQILVAERIPKADKLLRLEVDLGPLGRRQILSGIAEHYTPEQLIGLRIAVIANLAPRKMRGLESHGMLLAASADDHASKPILATFSDEVPLGSRIR